MNAYNIEKLKILLEDFYNLTGIKMCIYDHSENELCYYPAKLSDFCAILRSDPALDARCAECDRRAFEICKKTAKQYSYTCHAGLLECVSPVMHGDRIIGYVALGQARGDKEEIFSEKDIPKKMRERLCI